MFTVFYAGETQHTTYSVIFLSVGNAAQNNERSIFQQRRSKDGLMNKNYDTK
jgi:hypothetical protein